MFSPMTLPPAAHLKPMEKLVRAPAATQTLALMNVPLLTRTAPVS